MIVVAEVTDALTEDSEGSVTADVDAVLLSLSVHTVVVAIILVMGAKPDEVEIEDNEIATLCVRVVAIVAGDEVAV